MDTTRYRARVTKPLLKPWQAVVGGGAVIAVLFAAFGYATRNDATGDPKSDARRICREHLELRGTWADTQVTNQGTGRYRVTGTVNGTGYHCELQQTNNRWRVTEAGLTG